MIEFVDGLGTSIQWFYWSLLTIVVALLIAIAVGSKILTRMRRTRRERILDQLIDGAEGDSRPLDRGSARWAEVADIAIGLLTNLTAADRRVLASWLESSRFLEVADRWTTSRKPALRLRGVTLLVLTEQPGARALLTAFLSDPHPRVRSGAARLLGYFGTAANAADVFAAIRENRLPPSVGAMSILRILPQDTALLEANLRAPSSAARRVAAMLIGALGREQSAPKLHSALKDVDEDVRRAAAKSLGQLGLPESVPFLRSALDEASGAMLTTELTNAIFSCVPSTGSTRTDDLNAEEEMGR